ncbi:MAG TPA: FAD-binding protein [Streptosporangiaceae bacterium]|nr:FAD-binding protein [Streptosporangiaceae bacterium]
MTVSLTNWAGNVRFGADSVRRPASVPELQRLVASCARVRAIGTGHSFSPIADTTGDLVSVAGLPRVTELDSGRLRVRVSAGLTYAELAGYLHGHGLALANLASLPHISVAGACATGTHGSGDAVGSLATAVSALDLVTADGDVVTMTRSADGDEFAGAVVALGSLGIVVSLTLDVQPAFEIRQYVYENLPREQVDGQLAEVFAAGYSVSLFTRWRGPWIRQAWLKLLAGPARDAARDSAQPAVWYGGRLAAGQRHPVPGVPADSTTEQLGVAGPWHERLPHFRPEHVPSVGSELQSEYLLPRRSAADAMLAVDQIAAAVAPLVQISEIRTVAADGLWLSPCYGRDTVGIHFTWVADARAVAEVLPLVEAELAPWGARPHWGKLFSTSPEVISGLYPRLPDFRRLMSRFDPVGKFRNDFVDASISAGR